MTDVELRYLVTLESRDVFPRQYGPLFFRFLPDGAADSLVIPTGHSRFELRVWFERTGHVVDGLITYNPDKREVPVALVPRQAVLEGGPVRGALLCRDVEGAVVEALQSGNRTSLDLVGFARRAVVEMLVPRLRRFLRILRDTYGQYWLPDIEAWDSGDCSLADYCNGLRRLWVRWALPGGPAQRFQPGSDQPRAAEAVMESFDVPKYLSQSDWARIASLASEGFEPPAAAALIRSAHQTLREGERRHAVVEAVTAVEATVGHLLKRSRIGEAYQDPFFNMPLRTQVAIAAGLTRGTAVPELVRVEKLIKARNSIVHDGAPAPDDAGALVRETIEFLASLLEDPGVRFPRANHGNTLWPSDRDGPQH